MRIDAGAIFLGFRRMQGFGGSAVHHRKDHRAVGQNLPSRMALADVDEAPPMGKSTDSGDKDARWLRYANLKIEAAIFLLIVVTFAAVLGQSAITRQQLVLSPLTGQFVAYAYSDATSGGHSSISTDALKPLSWSCTIRDGVTYPYCGYGLRLNNGKQDEGLDFSHFKTITLRFSYRGPGDRLKLIVKAALPAGLRGKAGGEDMPLALEFPIVNGRNEVRLPLSQLAPEQWWVANHSFSPQEATPDLSNILAIEISTNGAAPRDLDVSVDDITFEGAYLSTEQWYLVILGVWLVLTGAFLVHRFLRMRREYEARQHRQAHETRVLARARTAAEAASSAKSRFLGNMSHELRTPLNAIIGYSFWLSRGDLTPKQLEAVKTIQSSGEHLLAVITDILDLAKIEAGKLALLPATFDLRDCIDGVRQMFRLPAEEKDLDFEVNVARDLPPMIVGDQKRVRQVLINLLGNAVKFTSTGQISLRVSLVSQTDDAARLRFVVEDTGFGIPADQLESIFSPFEQAGSAAECSGGTGLGLSITRQIVEMMHGEIYVESALGQGSRFTVEAPFPIATPAQGLLEARARPLRRVAP
ncbi:sensor histidine kinase [Caulobacter sp. LARHSG274]